jgi:predicted transcriptional regulator
MSEISATVEKRIRLSAERADRLSRLARSQEINESQIIEKALDILF